MDFSVLFHIPYLINNNIHHENPIYNLGPEDDYIFTENSRLVSTVLGFNVYQRTYLYNSITGHFETEIELDTNKINKIVKGSCVGNGSQLNYTIYNKGTDSSIPPNTNLISDTMNITNKITIPPESILAEGSILMPYLTRIWFGAVGLRHCPPITQHHQPLIKYVQLRRQIPRGPAYPQY